MMAPQQQVMAPVPTNVHYEPESDGWDGAGWAIRWGGLGWGRTARGYVAEVTHSDNDRSVTNKSPATLRLSSLTRKPKPMSQYVMANSWDLRASRLAQHCMRPVDGESCVA